MKSKMAETTKRKKIDADLAQLVEAWPKLTRRDKAEIMALMKSKGSGVEYAVNDIYEKR